VIATVIRVAKRRDGREFGPGPYVLGFKRLNWGDEFPFSVPAIENIEKLQLSGSVTLLAGENGSGKSTILEAIAAAIGFAEAGGELDRLGELPAVPRNVLNEHDVPLLAPVLGRTRPRNGYFLRAESFFNVAAFIDSGARFAPDLSIYGDVPLHAQSHGESFLALAANRFGAEGLYLLDEPEAALSVTGALALLAIVTRASKAGAQFVIATHSPIVLAAPGAQIYELDEAGIDTAGYDDLQAVRQMRGFLDAPDRYIRQITVDSEADDV
jgi:predicted ATPase